MSRRLLLALLALGVAQAAVYIARPTTSYRLLAIGADARDVGLVAAAYALFPLFLAIPLGRFSDRRSGARILVAGAAIQVVACVFLSVADTRLELGAASALLGIGHLGLALGAQDVVARESGPRDHDQHFGYLTALVALGQMVGPLLAGVLLGAHGSGSLSTSTTRAMLVAAGIAGVATLCALVSERGRVPAATAAPAPSRRGSVRSIADTRGVPAGIFASIAVLSAADIFTAYLPVLGEEIGIGPFAVGALLAIRAAATMAARIGIGALVRRIGRLRLISISAAAAAVALITIAFSENVLVLGLLSVVVGIGLGFGQPLSMTMVVQLVPEHARSTALALRLTGNRLGQVAVPAAAGIVAGTAGVASVFVLLAGMLLASAAAVQRPALRRAAAAGPPVRQEAADDESLLE